ncbi:efflux RND transporter permease subunit [Lachnospiraceae bacterium ZAX-1]
MLAKFSVKKPFTVIVGIVLVVVLGVVSLTRMTADLLPSMNLPYAIVMTTYPGASPEEVEERVSKPIESIMATISNIKNVSSTSADNYSLVILEFEQNANMDSVTIEIRESLDQLTSNFDDAIGNPIIMKLNPDMLPIMVAAADVDGMSRAQITEYVRDELMPEIESIEGVASVSVNGAIEETIEVVLNQNKIDKINEKIKASLNTSFADAESELTEAKDKLSSGKNELKSGKETMANSISSAQNQLNDKKMELVLTENELNSQLADLKETKTSVEQGLAGMAALNEGATTLREGIAQAEALGLPEEQLALMGIDLKALKKQYAKLEAQAKKIGEKMDQKDLTLESLPQVIEQMQGNLGQIDGGIAQMEEGLLNIAAGKTTINDTLESLNKSQILGSIEMGSASAELSSGEKQLEDAQETFDKAKEDAYEAASLDNILTIDMLNGILTAQNFSMPAGYVEEKGEDYLIRVGDKIKDAKDLSKLVLMDMDMDGVDPIKLADVADVGTADNTDEVYAIVNGNPAVMLTVEKQTGYATGDVTDKINARFAHLTDTNESLHTTVLMDQGIYIDMIVNSVLQNILYGGILAVLILLLFLKDIKPTVVIAFSIPISVVFAIVLMYFSGITLNVISLSGLALGIGMLVDNSIVVIENIYRLRNEGFSVKKASIEGAKEMSGAITASTLTTICVFLPIVFTQGMTRQLFVDMGLTIAYSLIASLIIALTFVPMMASGVLKNTKEKKHPWFDVIKKGYSKILEVCLRFKAIVFLVVVVLLVGSIYGALSNGTAFMPAMESNQMTLTLTAPDDATFKETTELSTEVIERISDIEDIETIGAMSGGGGLMGLGQSSNTEVSMYLIVKDNPTQTADELAKVIMDKTQDMECEISVSTSAMDMSMLGGSGVSIQVKGRDLDKLQVIAKDMANILEQTEGTIDISDGIEETTPEYRIAVNKEKAAQYHMTVAQVFQLVYNEVADAKVATTIATDVKDYEVFVSSLDKGALTRAKIEKLTFPYTDKEGEKEDIAIKDIVTFEEASGLSSISRDGQERYIAASAGIDEEHNIGLVSSEVQKEIDKYECPDGYTLTMTGEDETINEAIDQLYLMMILAVIFVYLIMVAQFQSLLSPFIIMFTIPLAFTGGFFALYFTGSEVSVIAIIGFVMLAGVIVNNGIVMVDYTNQLRREGMDKKEAIIEAARTRLRPVLMTALTTILGMSTMAVGLDSGSDMMQPLALVVIGGLTYGTLLTLIVVPCIYDLFHRKNKSMIEEEI